MKIHFSPHWTQPATLFRHTWEGIVNVDQFRWFVRRDMQDQLEMAREEIGARHVRAVGMYDDELRVFRPSPESFMGYAPKDPRTNWQIVDYAIDSMIDRGVQPMITTSFVPSAMAGGPVTVFTTKGHTSPPADWAQWEKLVSESVRHMIERYSAAMVREWYFEVWNEPNLKGWFWGGDKEGFLKLWQTTHRAIKGVDASLRLGGPSTARAEWIEDLWDFGCRHDCRPDYLIGHIYNNDSAEGAALAPFEGPQEDKGSKSPNFASGVIRGVRSLAGRLGFKGEIHWNEWGRSFHGIDKRREEPAEAAFIVRLLSESSQDADSFAYWCLSDIYDQVGYGREAFHGGYGLLNLQGLRKPAYRAFELLAKLGDQRIATAVNGDNHDDRIGAIVTNGQNGHRQILVYAYNHDDVPVKETIDVTIDLPEGEFRSPVLYRLDSTENNVVSQWRELGSPAYLSREQTKDLRATNVLKPCSHHAVQITNAGGKPQARFTMESPGLAFLEI